MKNRLDIKKYIIGIEKTFPVNNWKANNIHIWPILRIKLFFIFLYSLEQKTESEKPPDSLTRKIARKLKYLFLKVFKVIYFRIRIIFRYSDIKTWINNLEKKKHVFLDYNVHRVNFRQKRFDRFLDVFIEDNRLESDYVYFSGEHEFVPNCYKEENIKYPIKYKEDYIYYKKLFGKKKHEFHWEGFNNFLNYISKDPILKKNISDFSKDNVQLALSNFLHGVEFYKLVLAKTQPEAVVALCYYDLEFSTIIAAANQLNIKTIDLMHGPQNEFHLAYGSWSEVPSSGYDLLPKEFWCWDEPSMINIKNWTQSNTVHDVSVVGNYWVNYWKKNNSDSEPEHSDFVLYCLQPSPLSLEVLFPDSILNSIKNSSKVWYLRLHPRQMSDRIKIENYLHEKGVLDHQIDISNATELPLPMLLSNCKIHISHFSGSLSEAAMLNCRSIIINPIGISYYKHLIDSGAAIFLDYSNPNFELELDNIIDPTNNI